MNFADCHLLINHAPIIVPVVGFLVMIGGIVFRSEIVKRTAYCIFILGATSAIPSYFTGFRAEEVLFNLQLFDEKFVHPHEEIAKTFTILSVIIGLLSIVGLLANWKEKSFSNMMAYFTLAFCVVVLYFAKQTATTGGQVRHTEIRRVKE